MSKLHIRQLGIPICLSASTLFERMVKQYTTNPVNISFTSNVATSVINFIWNEIPLLSAIQVPWIVFSCLIGGTNVTLPRLSDIYIKREINLYFSVVTGIHYGTKPPPGQQPTNPRAEDMTRSESYVICSVVYRSGFWGAYPVWYLPAFREAADPVTDTSGPNIAGLHLYWIGFHISLENSISAQPIPLSPLLVIKVCDSPRISLFASQISQPRRACG